MERYLNTKLFIPHIRSILVKRPRLVDRLNINRSQKLIIVSAPAGYGKTTFVCSWIKQTNRTVAWLSLDENDNDLTQFLTYLALTLKGIDPIIGVEVLNTLKSSQSPSPQINGLLTMLLNDLTLVDTDFTLVLDDYHLITNPSVHESLTFLIDNIPPRMNIILISRIEPPIRLSRLRIGGQLIEIRSNDLRFTSLEAGDFLNQIMKLDLSSDEISMLETRTEGWIAGLQLAALSLQGRGDKQEFINNFSGSHRHLIDYLVEEVLSRQSVEIRAFLCQTSILDRFCAPLCDHVLGIDNSSQILQQIEGHDLFLIPLDDERVWFRYHNLFAEFLHLCLQDEQATIIPELHHRAAEWFLVNGNFSESLNNLLAAKDYPSAANLVEESARQMLERSELETFKKWVNRLPEEYIVTRPWLCVYHAWALRLSASPYKVVKARLRDAELALEKGGWRIYQDEPIGDPIITPDEAYDLIGNIFALHAFQAVFVDNVPLAKQMAEKAKSYEPAESFVRAAISFALGWVYRFSGKLADASREFQEAKSISLASGNIYVAVATSCRDAFGHSLAGNLHAALDRYFEAVRIAQGEGGGQLPVAGYAYVYIGGLYLEWNDLEKANRYLIDGIELCKRVGYIMDQVVGFSYLAHMRLIQGDINGAVDACNSAKKLSEYMKGYIHAQRWVEDCQVRIWAAERDVAALERWVADCQLGIDDNLSFKRDIEHTILARALVVLGRIQPTGRYNQDGLYLLERLLNFIKPVGLIGKEIEFLVLKSVALHNKGDMDKAVRVLERALTLAEPAEYVRMFVDEGVAMAELLTMVVALGDPTGYACTLLERIKNEQMNGGPHQIDYHRSVLVEPLSKRELEVLHLLATDLSGPEIADELTVALSTVRYHTNNIYGKLAVNSRRMAVRRARELGLLS